MENSIIIKSETGQIYYFKMTDISAITPATDGMHVHLRHAHISGGTMISHRAGAIVPKNVGLKLIEIMEAKTGVTVHSV